MSPGTRPGNQSACPRDRLAPITYLQLKKKLEDEFPGRLDICGEGTPQVTGFFEVMVAGKLVHSKKGGDGFVDTESKFLKLVAAIKAVLAQAGVP
ncbi:Selenoprotein W [Myotis davidii]|uniref:Selenoprotein W n=1 Tax=Myotis davidii TaxID=225400 RepID=L5MG03_MYODS|nr:Selenoprotein W [Myotis davidii]